MTITALIITFLLLFNQSALSKSHNGDDENSEEDLDEEITTTTERTGDRLNEKDHYSNTTVLDNGSDDIINLNIGGQRITTLRSTLTAVPGSKLAAIFARDTKSNTKSKDSDSNVYFFDYNPTHFSYLLDQLRTIKRIPDFKPYDINFTAPAVDVRFNFTIMLHELGLNLENFLSPSEGVHLNLSLPSLTGWKECYRGKYSAAFDFATLNKICNGKRLLVACRSVNDKSRLTVAGIGRRENLFDICLSGSYCNTNKRNGIGFYYVPEQVWGFDGRPKDWVPQSHYNYHGSASVSLNPCDTLDEYSQYRLCWSFRTSNHRGGGDRCGSTKNLHNSKEWERLVYQLD